MLNSDHIKSLLPTEIAALIDIEILPSVTSTNDYLKQIPVTNHIQLCLAEQQTQGRGRQGRAWHSPFAQNIYLSCRYPFAKAVGELTGLSLVVGLAVIKTLVAHEVKNKITIKWPNDIYWENKKLAGVLIETSLQTADTCNAIIGIGLNVNMLNDDQAVSQSWTSLQQILGKPVDRNNIVATLIHNLIYYIQQFKTHGLAGFISEWNAYDYLAGRTITLLNGQQEITGAATGINTEGRLLLKLADGSTQAFSSGEVSIKKSFSISRNHSRDHQGAS